MHPTHLATLQQVDLLAGYGQLPFSLEYYCEAQELEYLAAMIGGEDTPFARRFARLAQGLCEVVEGYGLLGFVPLAIEDGLAVARVLQMVDKANGYALTPVGAREQHMQHDLTQERVGGYVHAVGRVGGAQDDMCGDVAERE